MYYLKFSWINYYDFTLRVFEICSVLTVYKLLQPSLFAHCTTYLAYLIENERSEELEHTIISVVIKWFIASKPHLILDKKSNKIFWKHTR